MAVGSLADQLEVKTTEVADLKKAMDFYSGVIGFAWQMLSPKIRMADVVTDYAPHIMAFNTWAGRKIFSSRGAKARRRAACC